MYAPIPMTVPYSLFLSASCAKTAGHRQMIARNAKRIRESEDAMRRDFARDGWRCGRVIAVDDDGKRRERMMFVEREPFFILLAQCHVPKMLVTRQHFFLVIYHDHMTSHTSAIRFSPTASDTPTGTSDDVDCH